MILKMNVDNNYDNYDRQEQIKKNQPAMKWLKEMMEEDDRRWKEMTPEERKEAEEDDRELMDIIDTYRHRKLFS